MKDLLEAVVFSFALYMILSLFCFLTGNVLAGIIIFTGFILGFIIAAP